MGIRAALFWLSLFLALVGTWYLLDLPNQEELTVIVTGWFAVYGLWLLLFGAFFETTLFVGLYFPGSLIIFLGVGTAGSLEEAFVRSLIVTVGMYAGYMTNYTLGRFGWYRLFLKLGMERGIENARTKMQQNDIRYIGLTHWNMGLAAFTSTAAGTLQLPFFRYASITLAATVFWNIFWGTIVYALGETAFTIIGPWAVLGMLSVWISFELILLARKRYKTNNQSCEIVLNPSDQS